MTSTPTRHTKKNAELAANAGATAPGKAGSAGVRSVTMADVAARVGVSKMTVSRALKRSDGLGREDSQALRQRILQACTDMGYVLDHTARTFSSKRSGVVAVVIPSLNSSNFSETAQGITSVVEGAGLQLLLGYSDYRLENEERLIRELLTRRPEGVVLAGGSHTSDARTMLKASGVPVIETWDLPPNPIEHTVGFSNAEAAASMVRHLHGLGYRSIGFIGGTSNRDTRGADRRKGYADAIRALGLPENRIISFGQPPISMAQGSQALAQLLQRWPDVDAVLCVSDLAAFGALAECQRRAIAVPKRIAIAGFGDFEVGRNCYPAITTVAIDSHALGHATGELLLRAIDAARLGERIAPETVLIPYRVEQRGST